MDPPSFSTNDPKASFKMFQQGGRDQNDQQDYWESDSASDPVYYGLVVFPVLLIRFFPLYPHPSKVRWTTPSRNRAIPKRIWEGHCNPTLVWEGRCYLLSWCFKVLTQWPFFQINPRTRVGVKIIFS